MSIDSVISTTCTFFKEYLAAPILQQFRYVISYKSYRKDLEEQVGKLEYEMQRVHNNVERARNNNKRIYDIVSKWHESAETMVKEARELLESEGKANEDTCCYGKLPNPKTRYVFSSMAKNKMGVIQQLVNKCNDFKEVSYEGPPPGSVAPDLTTHIESTNLAPGQGGTVDAAALAMPSASNDYVPQSRVEVARCVISALADESKNVVGIYGPGGVGKSTLLEEVEKQIREQKLFGYVAKANVSKTPNIKGIQESIADYLRLTTINQSEDTSVRARKLRERLLQGERDSKILIILDDLWKRLDLKEVGIPCELDNKVVGCKLLLTSRYKDVLCNDMCSDKAVPVSRLKEEEARRLFKKIVGSKVDDREFVSLVDAVLKKCDGLPLLILTAAKILKNANSSIWRDYLDKVSSEEGIGAIIDSTIEWRYNRPSDRDIIDLFITCGLVGDSSIQVQDLFKYSMGMDLFDGSYNMQNAWDRMNASLESLRASSLLLDSDNDSVEIHDSYREAAISIAKKRDKLILVIRSDDGMQKEWRVDKLKKYYAISLSNVDIHELPEGIECPKLKLFLLCSNNGRLNVPDSFFKSMEELRVLGLAGLRLTSLPSSFQFLENLQTLCLDQCVLKDVTILSKLQRLQVLSFFGSKLVSLPKEVGELTKLRLLDLRNCFELETIEPGVLGSLAQLEELYMEDSFDRWETENITTAQSNACLIELNNMTKLSTLYISIPDATALPKDLPFGKLNKYKIHIGDVWDWSGEYKESRTIKLKLGSGSILREEWIQVTLQKTQDLYLDGLEGNKRSVQELCREGFQELKHLHVRDSPSIQYIVQLMEWPLSLGFPVLEELIIEGLINLEKICNGRLIDGSLSKLRVVKVESCDKLKNVFLRSLVRGLSQLKEIEVRNCQSLQEIISDAGEEDEEKDRGDVGKVELRELHRLTLESLPEITSFCTKTKRTSGITAENELGATCAFFDEQQVSFPLLESLTLSNLPKVKEIWHDITALELFSNLQSLRVHNCSFPLRGIKWNLLLKLANLESLTIENCQDVQQVFDFRGLKFSENNGVVLPRLTNFHLSDLPNLMCIWDENLGEILRFGNFLLLKLQGCHNLRFLFSSSVVKAFSQIRRIEVANCKMMKEIIHEQGEEVREDIVFPELTFLSLKGLPNLTSVSCGLFDKVTFPNLEELRIEGIAVNELWHREVQVKSFGKLKHLKVKRCVHLSCVVPSFMFRWLHCLESLTVEACSLMEFIYELKGQNIRESKYLIAKQLTNLSLRDLQKLKHICGGDFSGNLCFENLKTLRIYDCPKISTFISPFPKSQMLERREEILGEGEIEVPAAPFFSEKVHFPSLQRLDISHVNSMEMIWGGHRSGYNFSKLKSIIVEFCENLSNIFPFGSLGQFRSLEFLEATNCNSLEGIFKFPPSNSFTKNAAVGIPFQNLHTIVIRRCQRLKNVFPSSIARGLIKLESLSIGECGIAELIFTTSDLTEDGADPIASFVFPRLTYLSLHDLPQLKSLYPQLHTIEWPLLKELSVCHCEKFKVFSESCDTNAENQLGISHQQALFSAGKIIPNLEELPLASKDVQMIKDGKFPENIFSNLKRLILACFHDEKAVFPSSVLIRTFNNLEELSMQCCSFEEIFSDDMSGRDGLMVSEGLAGEGKPVRAFGSLRWLSLFKLHNVKHIWRKDSLAAEILQNIRYLFMEQCNSLTILFPTSAMLKNLTVLEVEECSGLKSLMMSSVAKSLIQLIVMSISKSSAIEEIVSDDGNGAGEKVRFLKLKYLLLDCLDSLVSFSSTKCSFVFPCLDVVMVRKCPKMSIFSEGVCRTPKLDKVRTSWEDEEGRWDGDLSTTIQKLSS